MANLENELRKKASAHRAGMAEHSAITEVNRLIAEKGAEDIALLREMGMHQSVMRDTEKHAHRMELIDLEAKYGKIFTIAEIEEVACKFALKFLRSDKYQGEINPEMLPTIKEFFKDSEIEYNKANAGYNFFVLAPSSSFKLQKEPIPPKDPILFYKINDNFYRMIYKWGSDLTIYRRLIGWKYANKLNYLVCWFTVLLIPAATTWSLYFKYHWNKIDMGMTLIPLGLTIVGILISLLRLGDWSGDLRTWTHVFSNFDNQYNVPAWRTNYKAKL